MRAAAAAAAAAVASPCMLQRRTHTHRQICTNTAVITWSSAHGRQALAAPGHPFTLTLTHLLNATHTSHIAHTQTHSHAPICRAAAPPCCVPSAEPNSLPRTCSPSKHRPICSTSRMNWAPRDSVHGTLCLPLCTSVYRVAHTRISLSSLANKHGSVDFDCFTYIAIAGPAWTTGTFTNRSLRLSTNTIEQPAHSAAPRSINHQSNQSIGDAVTGGR